MYQFLALMNGILISIMIVLNGSLSGRYPAFIAAAMIHGVGSLFALFLYSLKKNKISLWNQKPKWIYLGGVIGVVTTVSQNLAFGYISITSVIALGLLGQMIISLIIDRFGLFGMKKRLIRPYTLLGLGISMLGIMIMLDNTVTTAVLAVAMSFASGISLVLSRTVNACLAEKTDALHGSLVNHLVGLLSTVLIAFLVLKENLTPTSMSGDFQPWIYLGGVFGVIVIIILNIIVPKIPAFQLTLLVFIGQLFSGILIDVIGGNRDLDTSFEGGIIIAVGVFVHMTMERITDIKEQKHKKYLEDIERNEKEYRDYIVKEYYKRNNITM